MTTPATHVLASRSELEAAQEAIAVQLAKLMPSQVRA